MLWVVPFLLAVLLLMPLAIERVHRPTRLRVSRVALSIFGDYVADESPRKQEQRDKMRAAHVGGTHRVYASRTLLYAAMAGISGSVFGVYVAGAGMFVLRISGEAIRAALPSALEFLANLTRVTQLAATELFALLLASSATIGAALALGVYYFRWELLDQRAHARATEIEATLPRTVAFIYALSRSGMTFPKVLDTLTRNEEIYGEAAVEIGVAVRDMNTFGTDVLTALQRLSQRTPSENMEEFSENLASVLGSGQSLSEFLEAQYERYQEEAESQQEQYLELLSTFAEAYVTVLVAGPLFFITILVVIGLVLEDTLPLLRVVSYVGLPLASVAFMVYVDSVTQSVGGSAGQDVSGEVTDTRLTGLEEPAVGLPDGGTVTDDPWAESRERLGAYEKLEDLLYYLGRPIDTMFRYPGLTFGVTVPLGLVWIFTRAGRVPLDLLPAARTLDNPVMEAAFVAVLVFAVVHELDKRRAKAVEASVPDFLDRLASINEAGMSVVESLERVTRSDLDALTPEVQRAWRDVRWGADVTTALRRMEERVRSNLVTRAVTLITNAVEASGDIAPVLHIAADETRASRRLRRERRQEMFTYLMVIYISFFVFLGIIAALTVSFIPAIQSAQIGGGGGSAFGAQVSTGLFAGIGDVQTEAYTLIFFHVSGIQAVCSGLIAGQLGEGSVRDGAKHTAILLALTLVAFALMGQP